MKNLLCIWLVSILLSSTIFGQTEYIDILYLNNGGVVKGVIIEQIPNVSIKIETQNGSVMIFKMEEIKKIVKEKVGSEKKAAITSDPIVDTPPPPPPPPSMGNSNSAYRFLGTYAVFEGGSHTVKPVSTTSKVDGQELPEREYDSYSGFIFKAMAVFQGSENLAFLLGGTVDKYANGTFTSYYVGGHLYLSPSNFQPFIVAKAGYGFGELEDEFNEEDIKFTGPYFSAGAGAKFYISQSWGLFGEAGYKYQGTSAEWEIKAVNGRTYKLETTQNIDGFQFLVGFFFYP